MAYGPHALLSFNGSWTSADAADEVWAFGIRLTTGTPAGGFLADPQTYVDAIADDVASWFSGAESRILALAQLDVLKCNNIDAAGHYADPTTHQHVYASPGPHGNTANLGSAIQSTAYSFTTGATSGRARRGRIYPPNAPLNMAGAFVQAQADVAAHVAAAVALLTLITINEPTGGLLVQPCIASKIDGTVRSINGVSVDSIVDVQRRRKNRAAGTRTAGDWPAG
jgi:hypothetical protein